MGEGPTSRESPYRVSCIFKALAKQIKNTSAQGSLKFREVSNSFWEVIRREKTRPKKLLTYLLILSQLVSAGPPFLDNHYCGYQLWPTVEMFAFIHLPG